MAQMAVLREGRTMEIVDAIISTPGAIQKDLTGRLGMSRKVLRGRLNLLRDLQLLDERPQARARRYFPTETLLRLKEKLRGREAGEKGSGA